MKYEARGISLIYNFKTIMKTATQNLENDHDQILQLIEIMYGMADSRSSDASHVETVIHLIRNYADGFHHAKEENLLFPAMIEKGFSKEQGPIAVMIHDHDLGRKYVNGMTEGLKLHINGMPEGLEIVYENMKRYGQLLQNHIAKENNILFRMADNALTFADQQKLLGEFEKIEKGEVYGENISEYLIAINNLSTLYIHKATV